MRISCCQNIKRPAPTLLKVPYLFHMCLVFVWSVYWVKGKSRLKPAKFFIRRGKQRDFRRLHPVFAYLPLVAKTHRITRHEFSERRWIRDHSSRRLDSVMQSATRSFTAAHMMP